MKPEYLRNVFVFLIKKKTKQNHRLLQKLVDFTSFYPFFKFLFVNISMILEFSLFHYEDRSIYWNSEIMTTSDHSKTRNLIKIQHFLHKCLL
jgi:hypothetical protein